MHTRENTIAIISVYFGRLPWYFKYFVHSCKYNATVQFYLITDARTIEENLPENICIVHKTLDQLEADITKNLGVRVRIMNPVKLCDFRPAYGVIFSDLLQNYDFWGHADIDVVFGNIRNFMTDEVLTRFDVISARPEYVTGFFALYRNRPVINYLFTRSRDYLGIFASNAYLGFDECGLLCDAVADGQQLSKLPVTVESITHVLLNQHENDQVRYFFDLIAVESVPGDIMWNNGRLVYKEEYEILLYHLISLKVHPLLQIPEWDYIPDIYFINEHHFSKQ